MIALPDVRAAAFRPSLMTRTMRALFATFALLLATSPTHAGLTVCNRTAQKATVALGRYNGTLWVSQGWWRIKPDRCAELISGKLLARYYYLFATDSAFANWDGNKIFCVGLFETFEIEGRGNCAARGLDKRGFFEIDTGDHLNWTHTLSNPK
jgi:uncharacterized membrane protein